MSLKATVWPWLKAAKFSVDILSWPIFLLRGTPPYAFGYQYYKRHQISLHLPPHVFTNSIKQGRYGLHIDERVVEYPWLFERLPDRSGRLLDAGSILNYRYLLRHPLLAQKQIFISTLAPEAFCHWRRSVSYVYEDLRSSCYRDGFFDWVVCISTLEHVGLDNCMLYTSETTKRENHRDDYLVAIREFYRMLRPGGQLFLSVPYGRYRNHGWLQVFDADMIDKLMAAFNPTRSAISYFKYESDGWRIALSEDLCEAEFFDIHARKQLDPDWAAAAHGLVCMEMTK